MIEDSLRCLSMLSLYMQSDNSTVIDAMSHIENVNEKLLAMKESNGKSLKEFVDSFDADVCFMVITTVKAETDQIMFDSLRKQFFAALCDNISQRFPPTRFMKAASMLNKATWPSDPLERALFGESKIAYLCKEFAFSSATTADIVLNYSLFKKGQEMGEHLSKFFMLLKTLPISSAACERGFSQMNLHHTSIRNRLAVESVSNLMMLSINGPPLSLFNARKYVISWLKSGKHLALDKATGLPKSQTAVRKSTLLCALFTSSVFFSVKFITI